VSDSNDAFLDIPSAHRKEVTVPDITWASITDDGRSADIRWDVVEGYAVEFDIWREEKKELPMVLVFCKLLTLVRDQERYGHTTHPS